jgi:hypothetical protein
MSAAFGAAIGRPDATVVALMGDGSFGFTCGELETIVRCGVPLKMIVFGNAVYGWIKASQKASYGQRYYGVDFRPGDHARAQQPPRNRLCRAAGGAPWGEAPKALRGVSVSSVCCPAPPWPSPVAHRARRTGAQQGGHRLGRVALAPGGLPQHIGHPGGRRTAGWPARSPAGLVGCWQTTPS